MSHHHGYTAQLHYVLLELDCVEVGIEIGYMISLLTYAHTHIVPQYCVWLGLGYLLLCHEVDEVISTWYVFALYEDTYTYTHVHRLQETEGKQPDGNDLVESICTV